MTRLIQLLADKLLVSMSGQSASMVKGPVGTMGNMRTVAVVASSPDVPLEAFVLELQHAMMKIGASVRLTSSEDLLDLYFIMLIYIFFKCTKSYEAVHRISWINGERLES